MIALKQWQSYTYMLFDIANNSWGLYRSSDMNAWEQVADLSLLAKPSFAKLEVYNDLLFFPSEIDIWFYNLHRIGNATQELNFPLGNANNNNLLQDIKATNSGFLVSLSQETRFYQIVNFDPPLQTLPTTTTDDDLLIPEPVLHETDPLLASTEISGPN